MQYIKKFFNSRFSEYILIISILLIFEFAFMLRYNYRLPFSYYFITLACVSVVPGIIILFKSSRLRFYCHLITIILSLVLFIANSCLFYYKTDVFSLGMISDIGDGMNMGIKYDIFIAFGFWLWIFIFTYIGIIILVFYILLNKHNSIEKPRFRYAFIIIFATLVLLFPNLYIRKNDEPIYTSPQDKRTYLNTFGLSTYNYRDITLILTNNLTHNFRKVEAQNLLKDIDDNMSIESPLFGEFKGKNIIMIMTETVEEYTIDEHLTPTLYELFYGKYSFSNAYGVGKSNYTYDAEFKSLTSMMYYNSDNLMHRYENNEFTNALPFILRNQGYTSTSFHSFSGEFFNRIKMHPALGFEKSYFGEDMIFTETDYWALDSEMFYQIKNKIIPIQDQPFFSFITTLTSHGNHDALRTELIPYYNMIEEDGRYGDYELEFKTLLAAHMDLDKGLKIMLDDLKAKKLENDTLIVIFSDHKNYSSQEITLKYSENITHEEYDYDRIPMAIYHPSLEKREISYLTSHYDITPTIMDLLGIKYNTNYYYGQSVFLYEIGKYKYKPLIFGYNRWIHINMIVYDKEIIYYNPEFTKEQVKRINQEIRNEVYSTIEKYHAFFLTDYFRKTINE